MQKNIGVSEKARQCGIRPMTVICRLHRGWTLEKALTTPVKQPKNKFILSNGQGLRDYCMKNKLGHKEYDRCCWLVKNKGLTPDEALNYHRPPQNQNWKWIDLVNRRRRKGIDKKLLEMPKHVLIELGIDKNTKYYYKGQRLKPYCRKVGISYNHIIKIKKLYGGSLNNIVDEYRNGKYLSWYKKNYVIYEDILPSEMDWFKRPIRKVEIKWE